MHENDTTKRCGHFSTTKVGERCDYCGMTKRVPDEPRPWEAAPTPGWSIVAADGRTIAIAFNGRWACPKPVGAVGGTCAREPGHDGGCFLDPACVLRGGAP
jgi:hypothetical protein